MRFTAKRLAGLGLVLALVLLGGCVGGRGADSAATSGPASPAWASPGTATRSPSASPPSPTTPRLSPRPTPSQSPAGRHSEPPGLAGDRRNAMAFAPLDRPSEVTVEGRVADQRAWSTSKPLVVAAFLDTVAGGDPDRVSARNRQLIDRALSESDADAVVALRTQIPGRPGLAMTRVLREIGDTTTVAPDASQGLMSWSIREQVRFMAALAAGRVVSKAASAYLLESMRPIRAHAWGLGTIGATAYKGGWLRQDTATRQLGIVDGYAVAIITDGVGPAVPQSDGDRAHVRQMNRLARLLDQRLAYERAHR